MGYGYRWKYGTDEVAKEARRQQNNASARKQYAANPEHKRKLKKESMERTRDALRARYRRINAERKLRVLSAYGGVCRCCLEDRPEFLCMDHINNDGAQHRRAIRNSGGTGTYAWLERNGYPKDIVQILCFNCNAAKGHFGYCPHELEIDEAVECACA